MSDLALAAALGYAGLLFLIAFLCDRNDRAGLLASPLVYTLSISIYCTSWTFYGAVGSAARNGLEYLTIYLGPTLVFLGFWGVLRKLLRISKRNNITSIADFLSSRYGKSDSVAAIVTLTAVAAAAPYIALQIKAIATSFEVIDVAARDSAGLAGLSEPRLAVEVWITVGLALFTILFGTRAIDIKERHFGVVAAIAVEALVKLAAILAVGFLAVFEIGGGLLPIMERMGDSVELTDETFGVRWFGLILLSGMAILCLPRQFQVTVVENQREEHLFTAAWLFPLYLFLMSLFILPIAVIGADMVPGGNPDMFVLTMPIAAGREDLALLAFLGGFSSGTSMVIVSCIALSTMISNHIVMPLALRSSRVPLGGGGDVQRFLLLSRRIAICVVLLIGLIYLRVGPSGGGLASIGLIAFVGVAQMMPALIGALYWPLANRRGAALGLSLGVGIWAYTLLLPGILAETGYWAGLTEHGPFGIAILRPDALFGMTSLDPTMHTLFWSLILNTLGLVFGSLSRAATPLEQLQAAQFVDAFHSPVDRSTLRHRTASVETLFDIAQRIMGADRAYAIFRNHARKQGVETDFPVADASFIDHLETRLAASVGAASARAMIQRATGSEVIGLDELVRIADETARLMRHSTEVERRSGEIEEAARQLRAANERLRSLDRQKDEFLSQVSHELRTPMTSIRSFTEILTTTPDLEEEEKQRFIGIIHSESIRLTHLLDEILDMNIVERGDKDVEIEEVEAETVLEQALDSCLGIVKSRDMRILQDHAAAGARIRVNKARLSQVFINIISNALKYNANPDPEIQIVSRIEDGAYRVEIADNGDGIAEEDRDVIFGKFARGQSAASQQGAGLGLAISRAIVERFDGTLTLLPPNGGGARFEIRIPLSEARAGIAAQ